MHSRVLFCLFLIVQAAPSRLSLAVEFSENTAYCMRSHKLCDVSTYWLIEVAPPDFAFLIAVRSTDPCPLLKGVPRCAESCVVRCGALRVGDFR